VHVGHRALLDEARRHAGVAGLGVVALTFDPHPLALLAPQRAPVPLTTVARRIELLRAAGADEVVVARFDAGYAAQSAEGFVDDVLVGQLRARVVVVGPDFRFGAGRAGTLEQLRALGVERGFEVAEVGPVTVEGIGRVSSTQVRDALRAGELERATQMLGRVHDVDGTVVLGHQRGRTLGFPTANLDCDPVLLPADGVYAVVARVLDAPGAAPGPLLRGVANLGARPTFAAGRSVEAHLFDFESDLYGRRLRVGFVARLRGEQKFDGVDALRAQIALDAGAARERLSREDPTWRLL
jgi:riboflavin kinase / FMN adenylyltransferase